jgi:hypothetical protein
MATSFSSLRSARKTVLDQLASAIKQESQKGAGADERFWKLTVDAKTRIGYARLRFLPAPAGEDVPWARVFSHALQGPGGSWFIENCPTTLGRTCPVCAENNKLWNSGIDADKEVARKRKRKLQYISNVLILEDPAHPENNGKVFLFKYGAKIQEKLKELLEPEFPDAQPANPFDFWEGCDFKLKSALAKGYQNYDKSSFDPPSELYPGADETKEAVWKAEYPLAEFTDEKAFRSYEDLQERFNRALTGQSQGPRTAEDAVKDELGAPSLADAKDAAAAVAATPKTAPKASKPAPAPKAAPKAATPADDADDDGEIRKFFAGLKDDE